MRDIYTRARAYVVNGIFYYTIVAITALVSFAMEEHVSIRVPLKTSVS